jgi:transcriptional regulator with XRE-family HTH domain
MPTADFIREVIRCNTCALIQYRTRTGNCRRCLRPLPSALHPLLPAHEPLEISSDRADEFLKPPNFQAVANIGKRIQQLRKSRGLTQNQLQMRSRVSRSYLARVETGLMTPSLRTVEKIALGLGIALSQFFIPAASPEILLEDPFIHGLRPFLRQLNSEQRRSVLQCLVSINQTSHRAVARGVRGGPKTISRFINFNGRTNPPDSMIRESTRQTSY